MNNKGFTMVELLCSIAILGIVLIMGICAARGSLANSLMATGNVADEDVYRAARNYVLDNDNRYGNSYSVCVSVQTLIDYGYLSKIGSKRVKNKLVKVSRDDGTFEIYDIRYTNSCN